MHAILDRLGLGERNPGTWIGSEAVTPKDGTLIDSFNPATGERIASVVASTPEGYDRLVESAEDAARAWRRIPAWRSTMLPRPSFTG